MKTKEVFALYSRFYDVLEQLYRFKLTKNPTVVEIVQQIQNGKSMMQAAYKEMRRMEMKVNFELIDFMCWISLQFILQTSRVTTWQELVLFLRENCDRFPGDIKNVLRLYKNNFEFLLSLQLGGNEEEFFVEMSRLWYRTYKLEK